MSTTNDYGMAHRVVRDRGDHKEEKGEERGDGRVRWERKRGRKGGIPEEETVRKCSPDLCETKGAMGEKNQRQGREERSDEG